MNFLEFCTSAGPGTLIEHGVCEAGNSHDGPWFGDEGCFDVERDFIMESIPPERYAEFISIHGSERAV